MAALCCFTMSLNAYAAVEYSIPTATLNKLLDEYRAAVKNGDSYLSLSSYGISGSAAKEDLRLLFTRINGDLGSITFGKYSESYTTSSIDTDGSGKIKGVSITYSERYRKDDGSCDTGLVKQDQQLVNNRFSYAKSLVKRNMTDAEKALVLYDFIITSVNYSEDAEYDDDGNAFYPDDTHTVVGYLRDGIAVCTGYAKLYAILLNEAGIPAVTVSSYDMAHDWVMLNIDGKWYHADPTWDDGVFDDGYTALYDLNNDTNDIGFAGHQYFLKSDEEFEELDHYNWEISYIVNPDWIDVTPEATQSGAFDDKFFSDKNEKYQCTSPMNYINGNWYFLDLKTMSLICATYDGSAEEIAIPNSDDQYPKYCFGYNNNIYICTNSFLYRYDTVGGHFDKILEIPESERELTVFSEMNISYDEMTLITAKYSFDENDDEVGGDFEVNTYHMSELEVKEKLAGDPVEDEFAGKNGETSSDQIDLSHIDQPERKKISAEDQSRLDAAEATSRRMMAFIYIGIAVVFLTFAVIAIVLAIRYSKKK